MFSLFFFRFHLIFLEILYSRCFLLMCFVESSLAIVLILVVAINLQIRQREKLISPMVTLNVFARQVPDVLVLFNLTPNILDLLKHPSESTPNL
ncbi:unnamed protein product [Brassica oleracea var. botrytis]|uniref:(rape) hypothetical protein n=1 Tax=Brassica napus TaxID=3708 RepID=A0A816RUA5_BRANA|nr:unnamed protein product [Brassica napus]